MSVVFRIGVESIEGIMGRASQAEEAIRRGEDVSTPLTIGFATWELFFFTASPNKIRLLEYVTEFQTPNIRELAKALRRDYRKVYADVHFLIEAGLLYRNGNAIFTDIDIKSATVIGRNLIKND